MRRNSYWQATYRSFYYADLYRDVVENWRGLAFRYMALLVIIVWALIALRLQFIFSSYIDGFVVPVINQLPMMTVNDHIFSIQPASPYEVKDPRTGRLLVRFDMKETDEKPPSGQDGIFVFRHRFFLQYQGRQKEVEFKEDWSSPFDVASYRQPLNYLRDYSALCLFFVLSFAGLLTQLLKAMIMGLIGKALSFLNRRSLTYPQLVRLSVVAMVPALLIDTLQRLLAVSMPYWSVLSFALAIGYLVFGIRSNSVAINRVSQDIGP